MSLGSVFDSIKNSAMNAGAAGVKAAQDAQKPATSQNDNNSGVDSFFWDNPTTWSQQANVPDDLYQYDDGTYNPATDSSLNASNKPAAPKTPSAATIGDRATRRGNFWGALATPEYYNSIFPWGRNQRDETQKKLEANQTKKRNQSIDNQIQRARNKGFDADIPMIFDPESNSYHTDYDRFIEEQPEFRMTDEAVLDWNRNHEGYELGPNNEVYEVDEQSNKSNTDNNYFDYYGDWLASQYGLDDSMQGSMSRIGGVVNRAGEATAGTSDVFIGPDGRIYDRSEGTPYNDADFASAATDKALSDLATSDKELAQMMRSLGIDPSSYDYGDGALYWKLWDMDESNLSDSQQHARNSIIFNAMEDLHNRYGAYPFMDEWGDDVSSRWKYFNDVYIPSRLNAWYGGYNTGDWTGDYNSIMPYGYYDYGGWINAMNGLNPQLYQRDEVSDEDIWNYENPLYTPGKGWNNTVFMQKENESNVGDYANDLWLLDAITRPEETGLTLDDYNRLMYRVSPQDIGNDAIYELPENTPFVPIDSNIQNYPFHTDPFASYQPVQGVDMSDGLDAVEAYKLYQEGLVPEYLITAAGSNVQNKNSNGQYTAQRNDRGKK